MWPWLLFVVRHNQVRQCPLLLLGPSLSSTAFSVAPVKRHHSPLCFAFLSPQYTGRWIKEISHCRNTSRLTPSTRFISRHANQLYSDCIHTLNHLSVTPSPSVSRCDVIEPCSRSTAADENAVESHADPSDSCIDNLLRLSFTFCDVLFWFFSCQDNHSIEWVDLMI